MQESQNSPSLEQAEDLTLFADEEFDTDDVDLFEFTGMDDSPLTNLKAIILSLDWEINDAILQELTDEIANLSKVWQNDKVAQVYLQGMDKLGRYIRGEGAYAHHNSIKLLLTYYYDFEKIVSSEKISGDEITALLKSDVRKFKILQYQLNKDKQPAAGTEQKEAEAQAEASETVAPIAEIDEDSSLASLKAAILEIDWEVTDKGLTNLQNEIHKAKKSQKENKSATVLLDGLDAISKYINEQKNHSHPEAFSLLHEFSSGLAALVDNKELSQEQQKAIIVDQVTNLNKLKAIIAEQAPAEPSSLEQDKLVEEALDFTSPVEETTEESSLEIEEELLLPDEEEETVAPALSASEEEAEQLETDITESEDIDSQVDDFFTDEKEEEEEALLTESIPEIEELSADAIMPVSDQVADDFIEEELSIGTEISPDLSNSGTDGLDENDLDFYFDDEEEEKVSEEAGGEKIDEEIDSFFTMDEDDVAPALAGADDEQGFNEDVEKLESDVPVPTDALNEKLDSFFGEEEEQPDIEEETLVTETEESDDTIAPALDGSDEKSGFNEEVTAADLEETPNEEIDSKLDSFFGEEEPEAALPEDEQAEEILAAEESASEDKDDFLTVAPALGDATDEGGFNVEATASELSELPDDLDDRLDSFFGSSQPPGETVSTSAAAFMDEDMQDDTAPAEEESFESFFGDEEEIQAEEADAAELHSFIEDLDQTNTPDVLDRGLELVQKIKSASHPEDKAVLLQLLESVFTLVPRDVERIPQGTIELAKDLEQSFAQVVPDENALVVSVGKYTAWQQELFTQIVKAGPTAPQQQGKPSAEMNDIFGGLRETIQQEFASLREELKKK